VTRIVLTRHGHVEGIAPPRFRGRADVPLTELGVRQAKAVAARIAAEWRPAAIYTSPLGRCVATGEAIATASGAAAEILPDLIDFDYGDWQWRSYDEMRIEAPDLFAAWMATPERVRFPRGESLGELIARAANVIRIVTARHPGDTVVLVGHDTINRALLMQFLDQPSSAYWRMIQSPCCLDEIDIADGGDIRVLRANDTAHLRGIA
jgi:phosphoserine phosphatase